MQQEILQRYYNNTATPDECEQVERWLADPAQQDAVEEYLQKSWEQGATETAPVKSFEWVFAEGLQREKGMARTIPLYQRRWFWSAASVACLLFLATGVWMGYQLHRREAGNSDWTLATAQTGAGQTTQLLLSDGSEVVLNGDSKLTFSSRMDVHPVVYLEGEAHFNIRDNKHPVMVKTRDLVTTTHGSQFNISAFPKDSTVTVSVEKGSAEVTRNDSTWPSIPLRIPGKDSSSTATKNGKQPAVLPLIKLIPVVVKEKQSMTFDKKNGMANINPYEVYTPAMSKGRLYFRNAGPAQIKQLLEEWFGVTVILNTNGAVSPEGYSAIFNEPDLNTVLQHLSETMHVDYNVNGNTVYLNW